MINISELSPERLLILAILIVLLVAAVIVLLIKYTRRLKPRSFKSKWASLKAMLPQKHNWRQAVVEADDLLGDGLKKKSIKGDSMGERLMNARDHFSDNEAVWEAHKLRKKIESEPDYQPGKNEVKKALLALRQGLRDIGVL